MQFYAEGEWGDCCLRYDQQEELQFVAILDRDVERQGAERECADCAGGE